MKNGYPAYSGSGLLIDNPENITHEGNVNAINKNMLLQETVYNSLVNFSFAGITISDRLGKIISWNKSIEDLTGIIQDEVIGRKIWDIHFQLIPKPNRNPELLIHLEKRYMSIINDSAFWQKQTFEQKITTLNGDLNVEVDSFTTNSETGNLLVTAFRDIRTQNQFKDSILQQNEALTKLNQFSIDLSRLSFTDNIEALITEKIKGLTGAIGAIFSEYNPKAQTLTPKHIELDSGLLEKMVSLFDSHVHKIHSSISDYMYFELSGKSIETGNSLTEISLGTIPFSIGTTAKFMLKADRFIRISYISDRKLLGTTLLALGTNQPDLNSEVLESFITLATSALKRKQIEKARWESDTMLRSITSNAADIILKLDEKGTILYTNHPLGEHTKEDVIGKNFCEWTVPEYYDLMIQSLENVFSKSITQTYQSRALGKNNEIRWYSSRISPVIENEEVKYAIIVISDINQQKKDESLLLENEEKYRIIAESNFDVIFIIDRFGKQIFINKSVEKVLGYQTEELIGKSLSEYIPDNCIANYLKQLENLFLYKEMCRFTTQMFHKNEYLIEVELSIKLIKIKGEYFGQGSIKDITVKKQAEEKLRNSIERNNALLGANPDLMFVFNSNCKIIDFHSESHDQLLVEPDKFLGKLIDDILPHEVVVTTREKVAKVIASGEPDYSNYELKIGTEIKYFESRYVACGNDQVLSIVRDITEQKQAEETLKMAKESYLDIFNSVSEAIYLLDESGNFLDLNKGAEKMYLRDKKELIGKSPFFVAAPDFNNIEDIQEKLERVLKTGLTEIFDFWAVRKNGEVFPKEVIVNRGTFFSKKVLIHTARDITEKKRIEDRIKDKNQELININNEKDKFFSIIAHDLRSPILSFMGITQIISEDLQSLSMSDIQQMTADMNKSANNLYGLLENLLEWSRLQRGMTNFLPKKIKLMPKVEEIMRTIMEAVNKKDITVEYLIPKELEVFADENMFASIIRNLVSNAVKFTPKGGKISLSADNTTDNKIEIIIKDTGIGMNEEIMNKLFGIDQHTSRIGTDGEPSSGLGLLLCKDFVEQHGGKLWAESIEEKGSTFHVSFPNEM
ncbi:MAG: PAS domain S-box protein [Prolixibacteraceae bacterium]